MALRESLLSPPLSGPLPPPGQRTREGSRLTSCSCPHPQWLQQTPQDVTGVAFTRGFPGLWSVYFLLGAGGYQDLWSSAWLAASLLADAHMKASVCPWVLWMCATRAPFPGRILRAFLLFGKWLPCRWEELLALSMEPEHFPFS